MRLVYYRGSHPNFGDDLNAITWPALAPELFDDDARHGFLGVGTLIGRDFPGLGRMHVFSSGVGYDRIEAAKRDFRFWCVRGPLSARALGLAPDLGVADGGVLTPDLLGIARAAAPDARPAVVPHWESLLAGGWAEACDIAGFTLVDPMQTPAQVIAQLARAPLIITESLHGAIMADVLRVPWIAIVTTANVPVFKWCDWTCSVGLPLRMIPLQPPSPGALRSFGRPGLGPLDRPVEIGAEQGFSQFADWALHRPKAAPVLNPGRVARAVTVRLREAVAGVSPAVTAKALRRAASETPQLSADGVIDDRKAALLARLADLRAAHADGDLDRL